MARSNAGLGSGAQEPGGGIQRYVRRLEQARTRRSVDLRPDADLGRCISTHRATRYG